MELRIEGLSMQEVRSVAAALQVPQSTLNHGFAAVGSSGRREGSLIYLPGKKELVLRWIYVRPKVRRSGVGRRLIERLVVKLENSRRRQISAYVPEENTPAQLFLHQLGFLAMLPINSDYFGDGQAAYRMIYTCLEEGDEV